MAHRLVSAVRALAASGLLAAAACAPAPPPPPPPAASVPVASATQPAPPLPDAPATLKRYPRPPLQGQPFKLGDTRLPEPVVATARKLFEQGLADPRGCEYRAIEVETGSVWSGSGGKLKTHGWVIPGDTQPRYSVALNGLVYRTESVGAAADLAADVEAMMKPRDERAAPYGFSNGEGAWISHETVTLMKVLLLLRAGHPRLAEKMWQQWHKQYGERRLSEDGDPYFLVASEWLWMSFDRGLTAHMRGDDALAWHSLQHLPQRRQSVAAEARGRGTDDKQIEQGLSFLDPLPQLLADQKRRRGRPSITAAAHQLDALQKLPEPQRITELIARLDEVNARQWGQPGGVSLASDAIVKALIDIGEPAVEPLIDAFEKDMRLTRSVHFWRDFSRHRTLLGVHEAAYAALATILENSFFSAASTGDSLSARGPEGRRLVASKLRAFWKKWRDVPLEKRWFDVLADNGAKPAQWVDAAEKITQRDNVRVSRGSMAFSGWVTTTPAAGGAPPKLRGEPLRARSQPSVTDLLQLRIDALGNETSAACSIARALALWDGKAGLASLAKQMKRAIKASASRSRTEHGHCIAGLTVARAEAGDRGALRAYAGWIRTTSPQHMSLHNVTGLFEPMWRHPQDPHILGAARALFSPGSAWLPLVADKSPSNGSYWDRGELINSPLRKVKPFAQHLLRALSDSTVVGELTVKSDKRFEVAFRDGATTSSSIGEADPLGAPVGSQFPMRRSDYYGWEMSEKNGAPRYRPIWTLKERDAALARLRAWVNKP